jgi:hypothetical protein
MPDALLLLSKAVFAAAGLGAGVRLAQIAHREGGIPLHAWGSAMVLVGGIGLVGFGLGPLFGERHPGFARGLMLVTDGVGRLVGMALCVFIWRVFGRGHALRTGVCAAILLALAVNWVRAWLAQSWPAPMPPLQRLENQIVLVLPFLWSALETRFEWDRARKQLALGLTDAMTAHRFALWSAACAGFVATGWAAAAAAVAPKPSAVLDALTLVQGVLNLGLATIVCVAFFPPAAYVRWVERGAPAS